MIGTTLSSRYRIEAVIGSGGMSTVYKAFDETLERDVALKIMHAAGMRDPGSLERFRREARTVAKLSHPHVVMVIDAGEDEGHPYIVFEHVRGETRKDRIRRDGAMPVSEAVAYAIEIGRALQAAHERGLVHRDVKPQNVLLDEEGRAKVTDFGIASGLEFEQLTGTGRVIGTTDYVSPEQAMGAPVTGQSDVYSLGIVLFEMLVGEVPFKADSAVSVAMKHVREGLPDVQRRRPEVSAALAAVLERATAKELQNRYATMGDFVRELEEVLTYEAARSGEATGEATAVLQALPGEAKRRGMRGRRLALAAVYLLVAVVVAVGAALLFGSDDDNPAPAAGGLSPIPLGQQDIADFDPPPGDAKENSENLDLALDGRSTTVWETENYDTPDLGGIKDGVGVYLDTGRPVVARGLRITTPKSGWKFSLYTANGGPPAVLAGWDAAGGGEMMRMREAFRLNTRGQAKRYYLVWITGLTEGSTGRSNAAISELELLG
jgi:eukaryotic-like serine/threonine-protein kinase